MNIDKTTPAKPDAKPEATVRFTVGDAPIYIGTDRYDPGTEVILTESQAKRLGAAVKFI